MNAYSRGDWRARQTLSYCNSRSPQSAARELRALMRSCKFYNVRVQLVPRAAYASMCSSLERIEPQQRARLHLTPLEIDCSNLLVSNVMALMLMQRRNSRANANLLP